MRATQALLNLLARYTVFLRYCVVGVLASGVFYCVANVSTLVLGHMDSSTTIFASAKFMDYHTTASAIARNDDEKADSSVATTLNEYAHNSNIFEKNSQNIANSQVAESTIDHTKPNSSQAEVPTQTLLATLLGSLTSFIFGYFAQMRLAFRAYPNHSTMLPRYLVLLALIAIYAQVITYLGSLLAFSYYLISAFIALSVPLFSYPLQKLWVFASPSSARAKTSKGGGQYELARIWADLQPRFYRPKLYPSSCQPRFCYFRFYITSFLLAPFCFLVVCYLYYLFAYHTFILSLDASGSHLRHLSRLSPCKSALKPRFLHLILFTQPPINPIFKEYL